MPVTKLGINLTQLIRVGWHKRVDGNNVETIIVAITDTRMDEMTLKVRGHNSFIHHAPMLEKRIKVINHQIADPKKVSGA